MAITFGDFNRLGRLYQGLIVVGVAGGILALFAWRFVSPLQTEIEDKESEVSALTQQVAVASARQQELAQFRAESDALEARLESLKAILPLDRETDQLLLQVEDAARQSSMNIIRVAPRATVEREVYTEWPIEMQVEATYHNLGLYLDRIRNLPRIVNISGLTLNRAGDGFSTSVRAVYTATTFVYREDTPLPGDPGGPEENAPAAD
jgi:Tfp pilus assembly protein PilO